MRLRLRAPPAGAVVSTQRLVKPIASSPSTGVRQRRAMPVPAVARDANRDVTEAEQPVQAPEHLGPHGQGQPTPVMHGEREPIDRVVLEEGLEPAPRPSIV